MYRINSPGFSNLRMQSPTSLELLLPNLPTNSAIALETAWDTRTGRAV